MTAKSIRLTVVYDNTTLREDLEPEWGFGCLVEAAGELLLFDTGGDGELLLRNMSRLGFDPSGIELLMISHDHWDHAGGLEIVLDKCACRCYLPGSAAGLAERGRQAGAEPVMVGDPVELVPGVWSTGELEGPVCEQGLVLMTADGPVLATGCAHPGVENMARAVKERFGSAPFLVLGGFHMRSHSPEQVDSVVDELKELGVERVGPCHCTGDMVIDRFEQDWGDDFLRVGCGFVLKLEAE
jgi:7,8-dihydropterin-6-yl-methyl-4-(beta-D-ribofuranosyl)aminobenzene 5'-phosphate synthase